LWKKCEKNVKQKSNPPKKKQSKCKKNKKSKKKTPKKRKTEKARIRLDFKLVKYYYNYDSYNCNPF
jgi:hypothetical protein